MNDVQITVADISYPAVGKKQGKITDSAGRQWQVWADKLHMFRAGESVMVTKIKTSEFQGRTYNTIDEFHPVTNVLPNAYGNQTPAPAAPAPLTRPQVFVPPGAADITRRMDIFICGMMNNWAANPNTNLAICSESDIIAMVSRLKIVWQRSFGDPISSGVTKQSSGSGMNDEIPF